MDNPSPRSRFQYLRQRQHEASLTVAEEAELANLVQELEAAEAAYLAPVTERLRQEREAIERRNSMLQGIVQRKEALAQRLRSFLTEAEAERRALDRELAAVLAAGPN